MSYQQVVHKLLLAAIIDQTLNLKLNPYQIIDFRQWPLDVVKTLLMLGQLLNLKSSSNFLFENFLLFFQFENLPEKFNATLLMFIIKAAPTVPWPILFNRSPNNSPNTDTSD